MSPKRDGCLREAQRKTLLGVKINGIEHARSGGKGHDLLEYYFYCEATISVAGTELGQTDQQATPKNHVNFEHLRFA